jgi:hypothetical protein
MRIAARSSLGIVLGSVAISLAGQTALPAPHTYGTSAVSYVRVPAGGFFPVNSADGYTGTVGGPRYGPQNFNYFQAPVQLPSGARPVSLELDFVDVNPIITVLGSLLECDSLFANCTYHPAAGGGDPDCSSITTGFVCSGYSFSSGAGSQSADLTPDAMTINNADKFYFLVAETAASQGAVIGMRVGYVLQVSPPPGTATFNDVPTNHPFFQFVEALAASGITGGCGGGNYCPNSPLTRGQMAVFLAKALGLQWP